MTNGALWQGDVGRSWAALATLTDRSFADLTRTLLARIADLPGHGVVDIGCGAGELALAIAAARPGARVLGLDISPDLLAVAESRAASAALALPPQFALGDAASMALPFAPDLLISRHGVMFFDAPVAAFAHLRRLAAPGARLAFSCFRAEADNPWAAEVAAITGLVPAAPQAEPPPGPFAFADPDRVRAILAAAGWVGVDCAAVDYAYVAGAGPDPVADALAFFRRIGPAARALRELPEAGRADAEAALVGWLAANRHGDTVRFPAAAWIVTAHTG